MMQVPSLPGVKRGMPKQVSAGVDSDSVDAQPDNIFSNLPDQHLPEVKPEPPAQAEFLNELPDQPLSTEENYKQVFDHDPARTAKVLSYADKGGLDPKFVDQNLDQVAKAASAPGTGFFATVEKNYPGTSEFLKKPENMAVVHDDLPNFADHEKLVQDASISLGLLGDLKRDVVAGYQNSVIGLAQRGQMPDTAIPEDAGLGHRLLSQATTLAADYPVMAIGAIPGRLAGAYAGAIVGAPLGGPVGAEVGGLVGAGAGGAMASFAAPDMIRDYLVQKYTKGSVDPVQVAEAGVKGGTLGLLTAGAGGLAKEFAPLLQKILPGTVGKAAVAAAPLAAETGVLSAATGQDPLEAGLLMGAMHMSGVGAESAIASYKTGKVKNFYLAMGKSAEASKLRERMPEKFKAHLEEITKDGPVENIFIPVDAAEEYFQSKGLDAAKVLEEMGAKDAFDEAKETGGDVKIPLATWVDKVVGTEHYQGLAEDIKFHEDDMTPRQELKAREEAKANLKLVEEKAQSDAESSGTMDQYHSRVESAKRVGVEVREQLDRTTMTPEEKDGIAQTIEARMRVIGHTMGVDPYEYFKEKAPLTIQDATYNEGKPSMKSDVLRAIRDEVSSVTASKGGYKGTEDGSIDGKFGAATEGPAYYVGKGYNKKEVVTAIDKAISGKALTEKQAKIVEEVYQNSGYDQEYKRVGEEPLLQSAKDRKSRAEAMGFDTSKTYYHGTPAGEFTEFLDSNYGVAGFFTQDKKFAKKFAEDDYYSDRGFVQKGEEQPHVFSVYLKAEKTWDYENKEDRKALYKAIEKKHGKEKAKYHKGEIELGLKEEAGKSWKFLEDHVIIDAIKSLGYDSMHVSESGVKNIAVFSPNQIRSVNAQFDPTKADSANILYQKQQVVPAFYSRMVKTVEEKMGGSASIEQINGMLKEIKPEERKWMGLDDFLKGKEKVKKDELLDFLRGNQLEIKEVTKKQALFADPELKDDPNVNETKFSQYTLPGGENYREVLFTLPTSQELPEGHTLVENKQAKLPGFAWQVNNPEGQIAGHGKTAEAAVENFFKTEKTANVYKSSHYDEANVLAHTRLNDRIDADGKRVLFVEEVQSDWHQEGRKKGYSSEAPADLTELPAGYSVEEYTPPLKFGNGEGQKEAYWSVTSPEGRKLITSADSKDDAVNSALNKLNREAKTDKVPDAPFKKTWHEFVLKRLIREAAEKGYDRIAWTTGEQQSARYDLSKQVDSVSTQKKPDGTYYVSIEKGGQILEEKYAMKESELESNFGKDLAQKIIKGEGKLQDDGSTLYSGLDLQVGGDGMKGFYDKMIPDFLNKFGKKYGAKVGEAKLPALSWEEVQANGGSQPGAQKVHSMDITPQLKEAALTEGFSLFQAKGDWDSPRGRIRFGNTQMGRTFSIDRFAKADKSTVIHELGHYFLETMGDIAEMESAPEAVKQDYQTLLKWFGVDERGKIEREHHENFARSFEQYLMEGKSPSPELTSAFSRFSDWLIGIYKELKNLNAPLTDEVRGVFDRMLATKEEITAAEKFTGYGALPEELLPPEAAKGIRTLEERARSMAEQTLLKPQMEEIKKDRQEFLAAERARLKVGAEKVVSELPVFKAMQDLRVGMTEKRLTSEVNKFAEGKPTIDFSSQVEALAEVHGFADGADLVKTMKEAQDSKAFESQVNALVEQGMKPHADLMNTDAIKARALEAIHNEGQTELLALEKTALDSLKHNREISQEASRRNRLQAKLEADASKEKAKEILSKKPAKEAARFQPYVTAERNAAVAVAKAIAKKDYEAASKAKRDQLMSHALASESMRIKREYERLQDQLGQIAKTGKSLQDMPYAFSFQLDKLLSSRGITEGNNAQIDSLIETAKRMETNREESGTIAQQTGLIKDNTGTWVPERLTDFVERINEDYYSMSLPQSVMNDVTKPMGDLTIAELRDLKFAATVISQLGKKYDRFLNDFIKADMKQAASEVRAEISENVGEPYSDKFKIGSKYGSKFREKLDAALNLPDALVPEMVNVLTLMEFLSGRAENSKIKDYIYRPMKQAEDSKLQRYEKMTKEVNDLIAAHYTPKELSSYKEQRYKFDFMDGRHLTREEILSLALNWGNEGNRDRVRRGFKLGDMEIQTILDKLDKKDWDFAQSVWNHLDTYFPEIEALEMRVNGVRPGKIESSKVFTKHGAYDGGYYPISYDFEKSSDAARTAEQKNALFKQFSTASAQTESGHAKARAATFDRPVRLSLDVLFNHLENVVHDLSFREAVIDANRFLKQKDVKDSISGALGLKGMKTIEDWVKSVASDQGETMGVGDKALRWFRFNTTFATLSFRAINFPMDVVGNSLNVVWEIGPKRYGTAMKEFAMNPKETKDFVEEKSPRMARRAQLRDRDISEMSKKWTGQESAYKHYGMYLQALADETVSVPLWAEVYKRAVAEHGEKKAIDIADEVVARTVGSGSMLDQVGAQRGGEFKKMTSMYYSYMSMMFNRAWLDGKMAGLEYKAGNVGGAIAIMAKTALFAWVLQSLNENFWRELGRNSQSDDKNSRNKRIIARTLSQPFGYVWLLRDVANPTIEKALGSPNASVHMSPVESAVETLLKPAADLGGSIFKGKMDPKLAEDSARSASVMFGYPQQLNTLTFNFLDWTQNRGEATWKDLISRRVKK